MAGGEGCCKTGDDGGCRNPASRIAHIFFITAFLLIIGFSLASLVVFVLKHNEIQSNLPEDSAGDCILYLDEGQVRGSDIGGGGFCRFAIYGIGTVALGATLYILVYVLKCVFGAELLSCFVLVEIPLLFFLLAISLAHSLNTTLCLALTCGAYVDADVPGSSCKDYESPGGTEFFNDILISEAISWAVTGTLMMLFVMYVIMAVAFWRKATRPEKSTL